jgi:hypothetical protein
MLALSVTSILFLCCCSCFCCSRFCWCCYYFFTSFLTLLNSCYETLCYDSYWLLLSPLSSLFVAALVSAVLASADAVTTPSPLILMRIVINNLTNLWIVAKLQLSHNISLCHLKLTLFVVAIEAAIYSMTHIVTSYCHLYTNFLLLLLLVLLFRLLMLSLLLHL